MASIGELEPDVASDDVAPQSEILGWYDNVRPIFIDLVGDYAGKELFMVEGDSLLRHCFSDKRIDFEDGFQLLHAVFVVERFLQNLLKRNCRFHVVFFEEHALLCIPAGARPAYSERYLMARAAVKKHLQQELPKSHPDVLVKSFRNLQGQDFINYRAENALHFVMLHDGAHVKDQTSMSTVQTLLRCIIYHFHNLSLNVALTNFIEFRDSKVFTMVSECSTTGRLADDVVQETYRASRLELMSLMGSDDEVKVDNAQLKSVAARLSQSTIPSEYAVTIQALCEYFTLEGANHFLASAYLLHTIMIRHLSLAQRSMATVNFKKDFETEVDEFLTEIASIISQLLEFDSHRTSSIADLVDGRLFRAILRACSHGQIVSKLPDIVNSEWESTKTIVEELCQESLSLQYKGKKMVAKVAKTVGHGVDHDEASVLPFSNTVLDKHLDQIRVVSNSPRSSGPRPAKIYRETTHWHNYRNPLETKSAPVKSFSKWKNPLRLNQLYMTEMVKYAASLTGAKGKVLDPETITVGPRQLIKYDDEKLSVSSPSSQSSTAVPSRPKKGPPKKGSKAAVASKLSKAEQMKADNTAAKGDTELNRILSIWTTNMKTIDRSQTPEERYQRANEYLKNLDKAKKVAMEVEVRFYMVQQLLQWWSIKRSASSTNGLNIVALLWSELRSMCALKSSLTKDIVTHMKKVTKIVGIPFATEDLETPSTERNPAFAFEYPAEKTLDIGMDQQAFQLEYCGPYMDRMLDAKRDPRVSSFVPDGWQRKVLDGLDADKSVFVVAPTSAGKTFISFYAMEQILRADNDGVLIYVAPTKALVNQIAAEIQGRFSKKFPVPGRGVWAIHTRDYRINNSTGCQILVTVPHILQIMLLSPSNAKSWSTRVRRIIFDEIHSIGQSEDGVVWEQLLLLAPCPIIALSATVGNPEQFNDWLTETQKSLGSEMTMIRHDTRYSDLRKYLYNPPSTFDFKGLGTSEATGLGLDGLEGFSSLHPITSLVDRSRGMTDDLALEPRDCWSLWRAMMAHQTDTYPVPKSLDPARALPHCIRKQEVLSWEKALKAHILEWLSDPASPFEKVLNTLIGPTSRAPGGEGTKIDSSSLEATTLPLLLELHKRRALPVILFNYDRAGCETIAYAVLEQLVEAENAWKEGPQWQKFSAGYEKYLEDKDKKPKKIVKGKSKQEDEKTSKLDQLRDGASKDSESASKYDSFDPKAPLAEFSFANQSALQTSELESAIHSLRWKNIKPELIELLRRGVGVHHAGMNRKYRQCVEMLFRGGFLRVVVATGTLSLGINMPCATVVFSGDSVFLTALNFRQAAGRAGRRGFDLLGNVVFQNIERERACRLLSSNLPHLSGHFPVTTSLVLRLFSLLNDSDNSPYAVKAINSLLSQPRLYLGSESFKAAVLHHLRFSIEYLRRNEMLGPQGQTVNFASVVQHLYYTENSAFAFHALLVGKYFHRLCFGIKKGEEETERTKEMLRTMMLTLSHIFGRRLISRVHSGEQAELIQQSSSKVYLDPMPAAATNILLAHNKSTLQIFTNYVKTFTTQHLKTYENCLPLTGVVVGAPSEALTDESGDIASGDVAGTESSAESGEDWQDGSDETSVGDHKSENGSDVTDWDADVSDDEVKMTPDTDSTSQDSSDEDHGKSDKDSSSESDSETEDQESNNGLFGFLHNLPAPKARSLFVALSGHGDNFKSIEDLCSSVREGVFLESAVIPHLQVHPKENKMPLNAYLLDFYKNGAIQPLEKANGIRRSDTWFLLNDFSMVLATICTSLALHLGLNDSSSDNDDLIDMMGTGEEVEVDNDDKEAAKFGTADSTTQLNSASGKPAGVQSHKKELKGADAVEYKQLMNVYKAFCLLKREFDGKFRAIWA